MKMKLLISVFTVLSIGILTGCSHSSPAPQAPVDCYGEYGECAGPCGLWGAAKVYHISVQASNGGKACPVAEGSKQVCTASVCPVADGHWCVTGGGFSPCAPHNPIIDSACTPQVPFVAQQLESDCRFNACYAAGDSCPAMQKSMKSLGPRPLKYQLLLNKQLKK